MDGRLTFLALGAIGAAVYFGAMRQETVPSVAVPAPAVAPEEWFAAVKADLKTARIAILKQNGSTVEAVARSAASYRAQISQWTRTPAARNAYQVCGDLVIALSEISIRPSQLQSALALEDACRDAIIPPRS